MGSREKHLTPHLKATELVALALYALGGGGTVVDTEDIAVCVNEISPGRFAWRKYPNQINLELVRVALSDARKYENGGLVTGTGRSGWSLTEGGQQWAETSAHLLVKPDFTFSRAQRTAGSIDERRRQRERARLLSTEAWAQWSTSRDGSSISLEAANDLFRIDRYVLGRARQLKVNRLREMFGDDAQLAPFIGAAASVVQEEGS